MRRVLILALTPFLANAQEALPDEGRGYEHVERFIKVLETVRENHVDGDNVSYEHLVNHALEGMLGSLDKFSVFYHPETAAFIANEKRQPDLPGLGLTLGKSDSFLRVIAVRSQSPAARANIAPGDRIVSIAGEDPSDLTLSQALITLSGKPGETVKLTLRRQADRENHEVELLRQVVKQVAIADSMLLPESREHKVGYIRLTEFTAPSHRELEAALDDLEDKGMKSLVFDLRGNPGGLLNISVQILGEFLPPATEVVTTRGRNPAFDAPPLKTPDRKRKKRGYPIAVLIDKNSASASELVAGALQDLERATIVGETSYGKGSVQNIMPQGGGTALRLTIAKYHTPSGKTPDQVGITPDQVVTISDHDREMLDLWRRRASVTPEEQAKLEAWTDPVLKAALEALAK